MDELIFEALAELGRRQRSYKLYRDYYEGKHQLMVPNMKLDSAYARLFRDKNDNLCEAVVDALANRLRVQGWTAPAEYQDALTQIDERSSFDRIQGEVHTEGATAGDSYVLVWPGRDGKVRESSQRADQCIVLYDHEDPTLRVLGAKMWVEKKHVRVNAYWPDRIERYVSARSGSRIPKKPADLLPLADNPVVENPWGEVPLFHAPNNALVGGSGRSELTNVVPLQDVLNKSLADMLVAGEYHALPVRALIGAGKIVDPDTGKEVKPDVSPGAILTLPKDGELAQFDAADLKGFLNEQEAMRREIGTVSGTPLHMLNLITGGFPSGESLKTAERPLTNKVLDRQTVLKDMWKFARRLAVRMELNITDYEDLPITPIWAPAETQSEKEQLANAETKLRLGFSRRAVLQTLGVEGEAADEMLAEADAEKDVDAARAATKFDAGLL